MLYVLQLRQQELKMKSQQPAKGIMLLSEYDDAQTYQIGCECTDPDHAHTLWVEHDKDIDAVTVTIYTKYTSPLWGVSRWKKMWTLLTKGYVEGEASLLLDKQTALNYADALKKAIKDLYGK
jgi:hypothetical protein